MRARLVTAIAVAAAIGALGGLAVAAANQVSTTPAPIPVVDRTTIAEPAGTDRRDEADDQGVTD